jgi:hypothetical protein
MRNSDSGVAGLVFAMLATGVIMTIVTGTYSHWIPLLLGIFVGLMAVNRINR